MGRAFRLHELCADLCCHPDGHHARQPLNPCRIHVCLFVLNTSIYLLLFQEVEGEMEGCVSKYLAHGIAIVVILHCLGDLQQFDEMDVEEDEDGEIFVAWGA